MSRPLEEQLVSHLEKARFAKAKKLLQQHPELWPTLSAMSDYAGDSDIVGFLQQQNYSRATPAFIEWIIDNEPDRKAATDHMGAALSSWIFWNHPKSLELAQRYIDAGADVNFDKAASLPLLCKSPGKPLDLLLANGADPNRVEKSNFGHIETPLTECLCDEPMEEKFWNLVKHGGDVTLPQNTKVLHIAAVKNLPEVVRHCLEKGISPNATVIVDEHSLDRYKCTPIEWLARHGGNLPCVLMLMHQGGHFDPHQPHLDESVLKSLALESAYRPAEFDEGAKAYDRFIEHLSAIEGSDFAKRIPRISRRNEESDGFLLTMNLAQHLASEILPQHPRVRKQHMYDRFDFDAGNPSRLFLQWMTKTRGNWASIYASLKPHADNVMDVRDVTRHFTETVVLPEFYAQTKHRSSLIDYQKARDLLLPPVAEALFEGRTLPQTFDLADAWHRKQPTLDAMRTVLRAGEWLPLAPDYHQGDLTLTFLTQAGALEQEGAKLKHCVGGYASHCIEGKTHIGSIRRSGERISTVELQELPDKPGGLKIIQHRGYMNRSVERNSPEYKLVADFLRDLAKGHITVDLRAIENRRADLKKKVVSVAEVIGQSVKSEEKLEAYQRAMFQGYLDIHSDKTQYVGNDDAAEKQKTRGTGKTLSLVPGGRTRWQSGDPKEFLQGTGIMEAIKTLAAEPPLLEKSKQCAVEV